MAVQAARLAPADHELRFLLAAAYAKLGLRTCALELLSALVMELGAHEGVEQLTAVVKKLGADEVSLQHRTAILQANVRALAQRRNSPIDITGEVAAWLERARTERVFRAVDANILRQSAAGTWVRFDNESANAAALVREDDAASARSIRRPVYLQGIDPPWLLRLFADRPPGQSMGERESITIVCQEIDRLMDGLAMIDLSDILASERTRVFVGAECGPALERHLHQSIDFGIMGTVFAARTTGAVTSGDRIGTAAIVHAVADAQSAELTRLLARIDETYGGRDPRWWANRFEAIQQGRERARVLIPTSLLSTFVQHSARDLADALRDLGCDVRVLIEPDDYTRLSSVAFARPFAEWQPDLVVSIGHTRSMLSNVLPRNVPLVTWVQDRCSDLFRNAAGQSVTPLDLLVGFPYPELFQTFGYPPEQVLTTPVLVNEKKFHASPVDPQVRAKFACDVAFVSHHAETPEQLAERLIGTFPPERQRAARGLIESLLSAFTQLLDRGLDAPIAAAIEGLCADACARTLKLRDAEMVAPVTAGYAYPLAERIYRHRMLDWAADMCTQRGWRLHIYGRGWDAHPRLHAFARGELRHDEELRAAYQSACVNLHAGLGGVHHQRIMECALSGGCTLARMNHDDIRLLEWWAQNEIAGEPHLCTEPDPQGAMARWRFTPVVDHWQSMMVHALYARLGMHTQHNRTGWQVLSPEQLERPWHDRHGTPMSFRAAWLLGDPSECGFWSRESFERTVAAILDQPERRAHVSSWQRSAAMEHFSYARFARRMMEKLTQCIAAAAYPHHSQL